MKQLEIKRYEVPNIAGQTLSDVLPLEDSQNSVITSDDVNDLHGRLESVLIDAIADSDTPEDLIARLEASATAMADSDAPYPVEAYHINEWSGHEIGLAFIIPNPADARPDWSYCIQSYIIVE